MAEEIRDDLTSVLIDKKTNSYHTESKYDFVLPSELTVTITLMEYRSLVTAKGEYDKEIAEKSKKNSEQYWEIDKLKKENARLKEKVIALLNGDEIEEEAEEKEE